MPDAKLGAKELALEAMQALQLRQTREALEEAITVAIELLDALDAAEADLEPEEDADRFEDDPHMGNSGLVAKATDDDEPSLGSLNCIGTFIGAQYEKTKWGTYSQENWAGGSNSDHEATG